MQKSPQLHNLLFCLRLAPYIFRPETNRTRSGFVHQVVQFICESYRVLGDGSFCMVLLSQTLYTALNTGTRLFRSA